MNKGIEKFTLLFILLISVWVASNISWGKDRWKGILESDARGYYAYLPAVFIYQDLNLSFFETIENGEYADPHYYYDYRVSANAKTINKYWIGTSICELPFFFAAHATTVLSGGKADGYSKLYPIFINLAGIFYGLIGLFFLSKMFDAYGFNSTNKNVSLLFIFFGTNLFYYTVVEPGMSHVFSFAVITTFFYYLKQFFEAPNQKKMIVLSLLLGLIFLIRPQNLLIVFIIPLAAGSKEKLVGGARWIISNFGKVLLAILFFFCIAFIQLLYYKLACGFFFVDSYPGESFNFLAPHIFEILFSYKKGLFVYTPFYLICLIGLVYLFKNLKWVFFSLFLFIVAITYFLSSWHNWWYGGSFSSRVYVDYLVVFSICYAYLLHNSGKNIRTGLIVISVIITLFCQFQTYQYRYAIIHWENMSKEMYWKNFFQLDKIEPTS